MDQIPTDALLLILGRLSERERIRFLSTCKKMVREWLQKRLPIAQAAFDAFKANCTTVGWTEDNEWEVRHFRVQHLVRGSLRQLTIVSLEEDGLVRITERETFILSWGKSLHSTDHVRFFAPWFHEVTSRKGGKTRSREPDHLVQMLLDASPRLA
jgi:hypothetical protein